MKRMLSSLLLCGTFTILCGVLTISGSAQMRAPTAPEDHAHAKTAPSTTLNVTISGKPASFTVAQLQMLPQKRVTVHNSHRSVDEVYTGALLTDVLMKAGGGDGTLGKALLHSYVRAGGTDGYWVLYSGIEIDGTAHAGDIIVATMADGKPLADNGQIMLVSSEDSKPQRWVRNLNAITVVKVE